MSFTDEYVYYKKDKVYVSLGNYCLTSMLLKENNIKYESHPFDWMVTCIENIIHIFEDNFVELLNQNNYSITSAKNTINNYYINNSQLLFTNTLTIDHQHHNLIDDGEYNYLVRCVDRIKTLHTRYSKIIFVMIQPLYLNNVSVKNDLALKLYNILLNKYGNIITLLIFNITSYANKEFKKTYLNSNLIVIELDTQMVLGNHGMMYFDNNGITKFLEIINDI